MDTLLPLTIFHARYAGRAAFVLALAMTACALGANLLTWRALGFVLGVACDDTVVAAHQLPAALFAARTMDTPFHTYWFVVVFLVCLVLGKRFLNRIARAHATTVHTYMATGQQNVTRMSTRDVIGVFMAL
jgi:hypothetical protein